MARSRSAPPSSARRATRARSSCAFCTGTRTIALAGLWSATPSAGKPVAEVLAPDGRAARGRHRRDGADARAYRLARRRHAVFCALPHGASAPRRSNALREARPSRASTCPRTFRLRDRRVPTRHWYGEHGCPGAPRRRPCTALVELQPRQAIAERRSRSRSPAVIPTASALASGSAGRGTVVVDTSTSR